jgi:hypothetical protein
MSPSSKPSVSDAAVVKRTGKNWAQWFALLDKAGAAKMQHPEIARHLHGQYQLPGWWAQMVTVEYERARGLRAKHQTAAGYVAGVSRTFDAPTGKIFRAWVDARLRRRWLGHALLTITTATRNKSVRLAWADGTRTEAYFTSKGTARCQVAVQHSKLPGAKSVLKMKKYWAAALERLAKSVM